MTTPPAKSFRAASTLALTLALAPLIVQAQSPVPSQPTPAASQVDTQPPLRFEVASIRPHQSTGDEPSNRQMLPGGRFVATATTVRTLIRVAFGTEDNRIAAAPQWIDSETFDINAVTVGHAEVTSPQQFQQLMLSLLEDRFQLEFHREQKEVPIYWLEVVKPGKLGPAIKPATPASQPNMSTNSNGSMASMSASKMSMADVAAALSRQAGRPVEDHTGLRGNFDFQIQWAPDETPNSAAPSLFTVLKEQLGLKLQPAKGIADTIVIDQVTHPTAN